MGHRTKKTRVQNRSTSTTRKSDQTKSRASRISHAHESPSSLRARPNTRCRPATRSSHSKSKPLRHLTSRVPPPLTSSVTRPCPRLLSSPPPPLAEPAPRAPTTAGVSSSVLPRAAAGRLQRLRSARASRATRAYRVASARLCACPRRTERVLPATTPGHSACCCGTPGSSRRLQSPSRPTSRCTASSATSASPSA